MKNITISLSNDLAEVLDRLCDKCNLSRYAFTMEALIEKIEQYSKNNVKEEEKEHLRKTVDLHPKEDLNNKPDFWDFLK
jgi:metal-responsive CopG/Arc/MetJ family transcriptional regulator